MSVFFTREMLWEAADHIKNDKTGNMLVQMARPIARKLKRYRIRAELSALSDWELRDIGIHRGDIPDVVAGMNDIDLGLALPGAGTTPDLRQRPGAFNNRRYI